MSTRANIRITATDNTRGAFAKVSASLRRMQGSVSSLLGPLRGLKAILPAIGLGILAKESIQAAEALRGMDARIRRVTESLGDYNKVQAELYALSQRNGSALTETAALFVSINRAAEDLGKGRDEVLQLTDTMQQLGVISGASGEAMKNSLRQFGQAMAGGVLRAEEFNSIIENTPEIASRMAKGLGLSVGQLRLAVVEGRVLSEDVFDSLIGQADEINADFSKMPLTIGRAWQALKNAMSRFIADANEAGGVTEGIANKIKSIANAMDDLNRRVASGELKQEFGLWIELMGDVGDQIDWLKGKFSELTPQGSGIDFAWSDFFKDLPALMTIAFTEIIGAVDRGIARINTAWQKLPLQWDKLWLNIKTKTQEWWIQITGIFQSDNAVAKSMGELQAAYSQTVQAIDADLRVLNAQLERQEQISIEASRNAVAAINEEQFARMDQRRGMIEVNAALEDLMSSNSELFGLSSRVTRELKDQAGAADVAGDSIDGLAKSSRDLYKSMFDVTTLNLKKSLEEGAKGAESAKDAIDDTTDSIFDLEEAMKQVQNNIQQGFSDLFVDLFSGKGVDSFKDFAKRVLDIFKRLVADIAAAWATARIFDLDANFSFGDIAKKVIGGSKVPGELINGGGIGGAIGQGVGGLGGIGKAISTGITKGLGAIKSIFGGGSVAHPGGAGAASGIGGGGFMAAAPVLAIGAFGISQQRKAVQQRMALQSEFFSEVGTGTSEQMGESSFDFRGMLNDAEAFFSTTRAGWRSTIEALNEAGVATKGWGAMLDENGDGLVKIQGDIEGVKQGLSGAATTGFHFAGSLTNAIEKGNNLRVNIQGDAEAISSALNAATAMGIGGFRNLESTATGVSATLTGDIARWNEFLQGFVNESIRAAISGVNSLGASASSATSQFLDLARAASSVRTGGSTINVPDHDTGLLNVPHDNYLANLHRGERVLTAAENRAMKGGNSGTNGETNAILHAIRRETRRQTRHMDNAARVM